MNYIDAVNYIHSLLKFGVRPGLTGMNALLRYLGNPERDLKYIHVAGTNGKGSVSTAMSNVLIEAGYNVGLYTSPFVSRFLERIQYNGKPIDEKVFAHNTKKVKACVEKLQGEGVIITEFEALTATAFLCFNELKCDAVVLEVGLGGRLDATNVIKNPLVNIITSLSLDHITILGDTIEKIAYEKCGTLKKGCNAVVSYGQPKGALKVIEDTVNQQNGTLIIPSERDVSVLKSDLFGTEFMYKNKFFKITMPGIHQVKNMVCVIGACEVLKNSFNISYAHIEKGIEKTVLPARVEVLKEKPLVILDGGHNEDGAKAFYEAVSPYLKNGKKIYALAGMMADKDVENSLKPLFQICTEIVCVTPNNPRAMKAEDLSNIGKKYCSSVISFDNAVEGVDYVLKHIEKDDIFLCVGSLYLAGEIREHLIKKL